VSQLDFSGFFSDRGPAAQIFYPIQPFGATGWQVWEKPRGATWVFGMIAAGAGGGGAGRSGGASTARGGGGAGGGSGAMKFIAPAIFLPDRLYIQVGRGGAGGAASGSAGVSGEQSQIALYPDVAGTKCLIVGFGAAGGVAGGTSSASAGGAGGNSTPIQSIAQMWMIQVGISGSPGGGGGVAGNNPGTSNIWTAGNSGFFGGAGGGSVTSVDQFGGDMRSDVTAWIPTVVGGAPGGGRGQDGIFMWGPLYFGGLGGCGGGSSDAGTGGRGGDGALACGGGGGGAGTTGGAGGKGGDGFAILVAA
jgi:hypothetical protein